MKKTTKRVVSAILSASMLLTSVFVNPVYAADTTVNAALAEYAETTSVVMASVPGVADGQTFGKDADLGSGLSVWLLKSSLSPFQVKSVNANFNDGEKTFSSADGNNAIQIGNGNEKITEADTVVGYVPNDDVEKGFAITVSGPTDIKVYGALSTSGAEDAKFALIDSVSYEVVDVQVTTRPNGEGTNYYVPTLKAPKAGTYYFFIPGKKSGLNVLEVDLTPSGEATENTTEAVTEAPTEATTEAATEATTEAATEATTEAAADKPAEPTGSTKSYVMGECSAINSAAVDTEFGQDAVIADGLSVFLAKATLGKFKTKASTVTINDKTYTKPETGCNAIQLGKGNKDVIYDDLTVGQEMPTTAEFEKALQLTVDGPCQLTVYGVISTSGESESPIVVANKDTYVVAGKGKVTSTLSTNDEGKEVRSDNTVPTFDIPAAGTYMILMSDNKTGLNVYEIELKAAGETPVVPVTEAPTEASTEAPTEASTEAPTEVLTEEVVTGDINVYIGQSNATAADKVFTVKNGDTIDVPFYLENRAAGFNNFTLFVNYDPEVIKATKVTIGDAIVNDPAFVGADDLQAQVTDTVKAENTDYDAKWVGKSFAEAGRVKLAAFSKNDATNYVFKDSGVIFTISFTVVDAQKAAALTSKGYATDLGIEIVQNGFRDELGSVNAPINTKVLNTVYLAASGETTEPTTEAPTTAPTTEAPTAEPTTEAPTTAPTTEAPTTAPTTEAPTTAPTTEAPTTAPTTVAPTTETTTAAPYSPSRGSSGGGGSSSRRASVTTVKEDDTETTTRTRAANNAGEGSFTVKGKNGADVVITPPTARREVSDFVDVPKSHWAYASIMKLAELGIVNGVGDDRFAPADPCKRADFIIMINNTLGIKGTARINFSDVAANKYYYNPVGVAYEIGIASGYGDDTFKPENYCTREEMMVLVAKTFEFLGETVTTADQDSLTRFGDYEEISWWAKPYTAYLVEEGMVAGTGANFEPKVYMNRASLAVLIAQVYDRVVAMAAERGTSVDDVVEEIVEEESLEEEEVTAESVLAYAEQVVAARDEIKKDYLEDISSEVSENFTARSAELDKFVKTLSDDMSEEDVEKANVKLKEFDELFSDIIAEVTE